MELIDTKTREIKTALLTLSQKIFAELNKYLERGGVFPHVSKVIIEELSDTGSRVSTQYVPDIGLFFRFKDGYSERFHSDYVRCYKTLENHLKIALLLDKMVCTLSTSFRLTKERLVSDFMYFLLQRHENLVFSDEVFQEMFDDFMEYFESNEVLYEVQIPLENFRVETDEIHLSDDWRIIRLSKEQIQEAIPTFLSLGGQPPFDFTRTRFSLVRKFTTPKFILKEGEKIPKQRTEVTKGVDAIIRALKVLKKGVFALKPVRIIPLKFNPSGIGSSTGMGEHSTWGVKYVLQDEDIEELNSLISFLKKKRKTKSLTVALTRLYTADWKRSLEDKLLDYMIALESLFVLTDDELSYRFSLRISIFLGKNMQEREQLYSLSKLAYSIRSKIVHGFQMKAIQRLLKSENMNLRGLTDELENILRRAIKAYIKVLNKGMKFDDVIQSINKQLVSDSAFFAIQEIITSSRPKKKKIELLKAQGGTSDLLLEWLEEEGYFEEN